MLAHDHTEHSTCSLMHKVLTLQSHPDMQNKTHHMHTQAQGAQEKCRKASICILQSCFSNAFHLLWLQQFQVLLTFFSKSFSHFPHGTCTLSVSNIYLASHEIYHLLCTPIPRNTILGSIPCMKACTWHTRVSPSLPHFPKWLAHTLSLATQLWNTIPDTQYRLSMWALPGSFAITKGILFSFLSSTYLYA